MNKVTTNCIVEASTLSLVYLMGSAQWSTELGHKLTPYSPWTATLQTSRCGPSFLRMPCLGAAGSNDLTPASACLILGKHKVAGGSMPRLWLPCEHAMASCLPWMKLMPPWYAGTEELGLQRHWEYLTRYWLTACAD
eukprot:1160123-Pelagomonas_calceolata.AAC.7